MLNNAFRVLISVRSKLFFSFLAMSALLALLGGYAFHAISTTGAVVENTFDRPLMAINYARSAGQTFTQMELDLVNGADRESLSETFETFQSDLTVAKNRSISDRSVPFFEDVEKLTARWARMAMADQSALTEAESQQQAALASEIEDNLDIIVELQTNESFRNRETALEGVGKVESYALWATGLALALSVLLSGWLGLTIIKPLKAAALAARKISAGDLNTKIPEGGDDETGALLKTLGSMQENIRGRMAREQSARALAQTRLAESLENSKDAIILTDSKGQIIVANNQVQTMFPDLENTQVLASNLDALFTRRGVPKNIPHIHDEAQNEIRFEDGRWARVNASDTEEGGRLIIWTDISQAKAAHRNLMIAKEQAEAANRAKTLFLAAMSHELRTPLNAVIGFADVMSMQHQQGGDPKQLEMCQLISRNGAQLLKIVQDVLNIADTEDTEILSTSEEIVDLKEVVTFCLKTIAGEMQPKRLRLIWDSQMSPVRVRGDRVRLQQAVLNLLSNAIKFNQEDGRIKVDIRLQSDGSAAIDVIDDGIGIKSENLARMVEPFEQADNSYSRRYEGAGLGLSVVQKIMKLHKGELRLRSAYGKGTCATLILPEALVNPADNPQVQLQAEDSESVNISQLGSAA
ncbi:ATP-binding protein [Litorimonas sp.]|uniref:sensor histidine kinase n=1 Tax=Litorimonas sp. TaxID=1892381 RepID=UPI003A8A98FB